MFICLLVAISCFQAPKMRPRKKRYLVAHKPGFLPLMEKVHSCPALGGSKGQVPWPLYSGIGDKAVETHIKPVPGNQLKQEVTW